MQAVVTASAVVFGIDFPKIIQQSLSPALVAFSVCYGLGKKLLANLLLCDRLPGI